MKSQTEPRPTPETDACFDDVKHHRPPPELIAFCRHLERQRDELLEFIELFADADIKGTEDRALRYMFIGFQGNARQAITNVKGDQKQ